MSECTTGTQSYNLVRDPIPNQADAVATAAISHKASMQTPLKPSLIHHSIIMSNIANESAGSSIASLLVESVSTMLRMVPAGQDQQSTAFRAIHSVYQ